MRPFISIAVIARTNRRIKSKEARTTITQHRIMIKLVRTSTTPLQNISIAFTQPWRYRQTIWIFLTDFVFGDSIEFIDCKVFRESLGQAIHGCLWNEDEWSCGMRI
jgi:hypothetical protein